jgi:ATP-dependent DNA ligase
VVYSESRRRIGRSITFEVCLPRKAKEPPSGPGWIHEIKHDGFRIAVPIDVRAGPDAG